MGQLCDIRRVIFWVCWLVPSLIEAALGPFPSLSLCPCFPPVFLKFLRGRLSICLPEREKQIEKGCDNDNLFRFLCTRRCVNSCRFVHAAGLIRMGASSLLSSNGSNDSWWILFQRYLDNKAYFAIFFLLLFYIPLLFLF